MSNMVLLVVGVAIGIYGSREGIRIVGKQLESILGKPPLIRETSGNFWRKIHNKTFMKNGEDKAVTLEDKITNCFADVILPPVLFNQLCMLTLAMANTKRYDVPFRHMLFYGPPGTGKTMVAKKLAQISGLDYA